jgi:ADP-heptose:LPS heptosyltransferase
MEQIVAHLATQPNTTVFLFGGGKNEQKTLNAWSSKHPQTIAVAGKLNLDRELILLSQLDLMLSMDSANMHLASLVDVPVISIWGATHPYVGFYGYRQTPHNAIQFPLPCRPCSVYGARPCRINPDKPPCIHQITPQTIIRKIENTINT